MGIWQTAQEGRLSMGRLALLTQIVVSLGFRCMMAFSRSATLYAHHHVVLVSSGSHCYRAACSIAFWSSISWTVTCPVRQLAPELTSTNLVQCKLPRQGPLLTLHRWQAEVAFATMMSIVCVCAIPGTPNCLPEYMFANSSWPDADYPHGLNGLP